MTIPPFLRTGDKVALVAPAGYIEPRQLDSAIEIIESWGLKISIGKNAFSKHFNFSGTDAERIEDFQQAIDDREIKAIFCARGGYGVLRIFDKMDWSGFIENPKWIIGYSDITAFHSLINTTLKISSIHGPMPINFEKLKTEQNSLEYLKKILFGEKLTYSVPNNSHIFHQEIEGKLIGGNLSLLYSLRGTPYDFISENSILFIEDIDEYMYHLDRMIQNFRAGNKFSNLKAIILGGFTGIKENEIPFGSTVEESIINAIGKEQIPIINSFPAGHQTPNYPIILGSKIKILIEEEYIQILINH